MTKPKGRVPNLFLVGAAKSGTTSLYEIFRRHPEQIFTPAVKEPNYFAVEEVAQALNGPGDYQHESSKYSGDEASYKALYRDWRDQPYAVDCSVGYLYHEAAAARIREASPDAKIIMVLRNPIEAAFSMYAMKWRLTRERESNFRKAFLLSGQRRRQGWEHGWDYQGLFLYAEQVARYQALFPRESLLILLYDQLRSEPAAFAKSVSDFLGFELREDEFTGVVENVAPNLLQMLQTPRRHHREWRPELSLARYVPEQLKSAIKRQLAKRPGLTLRRADRAFLRGVFGPDVRKLSEEIGIDLSHWMAD